MGYKYFLNMAYKISNIFVSSGQKNNNAGEVFIAQPDEHKDSLAGRLFVLLEIESSKSKALKVANFLVDNLNYNYYQNEKILLREKLESVTVEHIFETTLTKVNKDLIEFLNQEKIKISPYALNITVGVIYGSELYFSSVGKNKNLLIYPQTRQDSSRDRYFLSDIGDNQKKQTQSTNLFKLFSDVISGSLPEDGYYFLTNEALKEYLSEKQIIDIVTKLPPAGAAQHIENILKQLNVNALFLGLIIKNTSGQQTASTPEEETRTNEVLDLNQTRRKTEEILKPAGIINLTKIKNWGLAGVSRLKKISPLASKKSSGSQELNSSDNISTSPEKKPLQLKEKVFFQKKSNFWSGSKIMEIFKTGLLGLISIFFYIIKFFSSTDNIKQLLLKIKYLPGFLKNKFISFLKFLAGLNLKSKLTLLVVIILLGAFAFSTSLYVEKNKKEKALKSVQELINSIEKNQNKIEANLLYSNEKDAQKLIKNNEEKLNTLQKQIREYSLETKKYQKLNTAHEKQEKEVMHLVLLTEDLELVKNLAPSNAISENLIRSNNELYLGDNKSSQIHKLNLENNSLKGLSATKMKKLSLPVKTDEIIYYFDSPQATTYNTETEEFKNIKVNLPENSQIKSMAEFAGNIYLLDSVNNQIYKHSNPSAGLKNGQNWLKDEVNLDSAQDLAIDGYIYILKNREIKKYLKGRQEEFKPEKPYPPLKEATKIQVSPEINKGYIYILEPAQKRLLVFNKQGEFQKQYQSPSFTDLKDFRVDEENNIIYFLAGNSVFKYEFEE